MSDEDELEQSAKQDYYDERVRPHLPSEEEDIPVEADDDDFSDVPEDGFDFVDPYEFFFGPDE